MKPKTYIEKNYKNQKQQLKICLELINYYLSDEDIINYENLKNDNISTKKKKVSRNGSNRA